MRWTTAGTEVSNALVRPVIAVATRARTPVVALVEEHCECDGAKDQREQDDEESSGGAAA